MCYRCLNAVVMMSMSVIAASAHGAPALVKIDLGGGSTENPASVSTPTAISAPTEASAGSAEETVKVSGRGVGADEKSALEDAFRDAIERVIGLYVDAETVAKNDEIVKDQILTHSNAYVTHYDKQSTKPMSGGFTEVRILATVKKRPLTQKIQDVMPTQTTAVNATGLQNAFAQMTTTAKRADDSAALLENALSGLNPVKSLLVANVRPETQKIITADGSQGNGANAAKQRALNRHDNTGLSADQVALRYLFELRLDREKYFKEFVPNLKRVLEQISLTPPKEVRLMELAERERGLAEVMESYRTGKDNRTEKRYDGMSCRNGAAKCPRKGLPCGLGILDGLHVYAFTGDAGYRVWEFSNHVKFAPKSGGSFSWSSIRLEPGALGDRYAKATVEVALVSQLNADGSIGKVTLYELDKATLPVWNKWMCGLVASEALRERYLNYNGSDDKVNYSIVLSDEKGDELAVFPWEVLMADLMNVKFAEQPNKGHVYVSPFVGCFGECYIEWKSLVVDKSLLPKIKQIKIELAQ